MEKVLDVVKCAGRIFRDRLERVLNEGGLTREQYQRYLSMQYHLTNGVQRHFLSLAGHPVMRGRRNLREFLVNFAWEEEMHYEIARRDLDKLGLDLLECPLDAKLWWLYFDTAVVDKPFVRLGATCVLENLGSGGGDVAKQLLSRSDFINKANSHFIQIHLHEQLPHGQQIIAALEKAEPTAEELIDLERGARDASIQYLRLAAWALGQDPVMTAIDAAGR